MGGLQNKSRSFSLLGIRQFIHFCITLRNMDKSALPKTNISSLPRLSNRHARRLFLVRHGLCDNPAGTLSNQQLLTLIERLGFVQLDSINTVERAHHMILRARRQSYRPHQLKSLLEEEAGLFEHWTHDAAAIPARFYPFWKVRFARDEVRLKARWRNWRRDGFEEKFDAVLNHIRDNGPTMSRDLGNGERKGSGGWWDWHPSKTAIEYLWRTGALAVCHRDGFQKAYDLSERVIAREHLDQHPSESEVVDWACSSAMDRLGFATSGELAAFWDTVTPAETKAWCAARLGKDLIEVEIGSADGQGRQRVFARPDIFDEAAASPEPPGRMRILSPFDPAIRDRKRTERLFGFHYRIEVFVPAPKRKYGYYVFPLLEADRLIGRIDMKCQRDTSTLQVAALWLEPGFKPGRGRMKQLQAELGRMARFTNCDRIDFADGWIKTTS